MEQQLYETKKQGFRIRKASAQDAPQVLCFIRALAEYEGMADQVTGTETELADSLQSGKAECILGEQDGIPVGFALFFYHYSTFLCNAGLYLEDLFVLPEYRGRGLGKELLRCVARIARERGCRRLEWWCLDWNRPSIDFYLSMGAERMSDWTTYRLTEDALEQAVR